MIKRTFTAAGAAGVLALTAYASLGQTVDSIPRSTTTIAPPADNTKSNRSDPSNMARTADDQKEDKSDLNITQQIRKSVVADKSLSVYAKNSKIVSVNGTVTLNGVVHTAAEKQSIGQKAGDVVGAAHVVNDIKVEVSAR